MVHTMPAYRNLCAALCLLLGWGFAAGVPAAPAALFGYREVPQTDMAPLHQWLRVMERHLTQDVPPGSCQETRFNRCHLTHWRAFLKSIRQLDPKAQLAAVNRYANHLPYVLDEDNYGVPDYWAIVREFLDNGGDCEDYAITKFYSLKWLGFDPDRMRIVVVQDTNLRVPHAILALYRQDGQILVLDNQIRQIVPAESIVHYAPVFSVNEAHWWIHYPRSLKRP